MSLTRGVLPVHDCGQPHLIAERVIPMKPELLETLRGITREEVSKGLKGKRSAYRSEQKIVTKLTAVLIKTKDLPIQTVPQIPGFTLKEAVRTERILVDFDTLEARTGTPIHKHPAEECWFILRGRGFIRVQGQKYQWEEQDFLYVPANVEHQLVNTSDETMIYVAVLAPPIIPRRDLTVVEEFRPEHLTR